MKVALTDATGFIGSHVLTELREHGHEVTALVRDASKAEILGDRGATPTVVDLYDRAAVVGVLRDADAAIHTASPGDATSADLDSAVADAAIEALSGSGKPYLQISGLWIYGNNPSVSEQSPVDSPPLVAWKEPIERRVLAAPDMRAVLIAPGVAYGDGGGGIPGLLLASPRDDAGNLIMLGSGQQHWSTVHVADLANFFRLVLEQDSARGRYVVGPGPAPALRQAPARAARGARQGAHGPSRNARRGADRDRTRTGRHRDHGAQHRARAAGPRGPARGPQRPARRDDRPDLQGPTCARRGVGCRRQPACLSRISRSRDRVQTNAGRRPTRRAGPEIRQRRARRRSETRRMLGTSLDRPVLEGRVPQLL
jgi:uncharacterized protein YbjT (DUF2867 family)